MTLETTGKGHMILLYQGQRRNASHHRATSNNPVQTLPKDAIGLRI